MSPGHFGSLAAAKKRFNGGSPTSTVGRELPVLLRTSLSCAQSMPILLKTSPEGRKKEKFLSKPHHSCSGLFFPYFLAAFPLWFCSLQDKPTPSAGTRTSSHLNTPLLTAFPWNQHLPRCVFWGSPPYFPCGGCRWVGFACSGWNLHQCVLPGYQPCESPP